MSNLNTGRPGHNRNRSRRSGPSNGRRTSSSPKRNNGISTANALNARNKYLEKAKEALSTGEKIEAENFFQHADHYARIVNEAEERSSYQNRSEQKDETKNSNEEGTVTELPKKEEENNSETDGNAVEELPKTASDAN